MAMRIARARGARIGGADAQLFSLRSIITRMAYIHISFERYSPFDAFQRKFIHWKAIVYMYSCMESSTPTKHFYQLMCIKFFVIWSLS